MSFPKLEDVDEVTEQEQENHDSSQYEAAVPPTPSFKGRLNLAEFAFASKPTIKLESSSSSSSPSRSPRVLLRAESANPPASTASTASNVTNRKRAAATLSLSASPSPKRKSRSPSKYAPPTTYSHLPELRDVLAPNLITLFIGLNPGIQTSVSGHAYAHPSNLFWKLLHSSGCTTRRCSPSEDGSLPQLFNLGNTNIVSRPTRNGGELKKEELDEGVEILEEKVRTYKPESVCLVGKGIWESVWRVKKGRGIRKEEFRYGWQEDRMGVGGEGEWEGARIFVACSTSGLAAGLSPMEKEGIWRELGVWVERRREERGKE